jgi:CBS domain-containing protein
VADHIGREEVFVPKKKWHNGTNFREEAERKLKSGLPRPEEKLPEAVEENVRRLMRTGAITCGASASIREVAQILAVNSSHYCVVTNQSHEVLGIISARSILRAFDRDLDKTTAQDILLPHTFTITPNSTLKEAIRLMDGRKIEHLIVTSDQDGSRAVVGLLHVEDIIAKMARED